MYHNLFNCKAIPSYRMQSNEKRFGICRSKCFETSVQRKTNKIPVFAIWNCRIVSFSMLYMKLVHVTIFFLQKFFLFEVKSQNL